MDVIDMPQITCAGGSATGQPVFASAHRGGGSMPDIGQAVTSGTSLTDIVPDSGSTGPEICARSIRAPGDGQLHLGA